MNEQFRTTIEIIGYKNGTIKVQELHPEKQLTNLYGSFLHPERIEAIGVLLLSCPAVPLNTCDIKKTEFIKPRPERSPLETLRSRWATIRKKMIPLVFEQYGEICQHCKNTENIVIDHIIPLAKGGTNNLKNLQPLCQSCNSKKGTGAA